MRRCSALAHRLRIGAVDAASRATTQAWRNVVAHLRRRPPSTAVEVEWRAACRCSVAWRAGGARAARRTCGARRCAACRSQPSAPTAPRCRRRRPPPPAARCATASLLSVCANTVDGPSAGLIICANSNICGKNNPALAPRLVLCVPRDRSCERVLSPPSRARGAARTVLAPRLLRRQRRSVLPRRHSEVQRDDKKLVNVAEAVLAPQLGRAVRGVARGGARRLDSARPAARVHELRRRVDDSGDSVNGKVRGDIEYNDLTIESTQSAMEALPLLDAAAAILASDPDGGWEPAPATMRGAFGASALD